MAKESTQKDKKHFFKDFKAELKKVIWPTPKQIINNTVAVITIVLITAIIVFALDLTFEMLNKYGVDKLKDVVKKDEIVNEIANGENSDATESELNPETESEENQEESGENTEGEEVT